MARRVKRSKEKSVVELEYWKNRRRIQTFVSSARKRGYIFPTNIVPKIPKKIEEGSVRKLQKYTVDYLYSKATAKTEQGKTITGKQKRVQERIQSAKKGGHTRKRNIERARKQREYKQREKDLFAQNEPDFDVQDTINRQENLERMYDDDYYDIFNEGGRVWERIQNMIEDASRESEEGAEYVRAFIMGAINNVDEYTLYKNLKNNEGEAISQAEKALQYFGHGSKSAPALQQLVRIMRGTELTAQESMKINEMAESAILDTDKFYTQVFNKYGK